MRNFVYPANLIAEKWGEFTVKFPDLPEAITSGKNRLDALAQASDCLEEAIAARISDRLDIPEPSAPRRRQALVPLPAPMAAKAALYLAVRESSESNSRLARRLGLDEREIRRMLDPRHATRLTRLQEVLNLLGKRLLVSMDNAA
jgi:antitoxin HicB